MLLRSTPEGNVAGARIVTPGAFNLATGGTTVRLNVDASGNLGLGVTPSAWGASFKPAIDLGTGAAIGAYSTFGPSLYANCYINSSSQYIYKNSAAAGAYQILNNAHYWYNAPSGTAGNAITFTQAMTLDASGNLLVGLTSGSYKFQAARSGDGITAGIVEIGRAHV